ncbi:hypothetical protein CR513_24031, partial [Mucuna pruriens]
MVCKEICIDFMGLVMALVIALTLMIICSPKRRVVLSSGMLHRNYQHQFWYKILYNHDMDDDGNLLSPQNCDEHIQSLGLINFTFTMVLTTSKQAAKKRSNLYKSLSQGRITLLSLSYKSVLWGGVRLAQIPLVWIMWCKNNIIVINPGLECGAANPKPTIVGWLLL